MSTGGGQNPFGAGPASQEVSDNTNTAIKDDGHKWAFSAYNAKKTAKSVELLCYIESDDRPTSKDNDNLLKRCGLPI